ncbi:hypothetical protein DPSP01_011685 [Paraphaeosphaeria sporulosa]|uniref:Uncharacterized protein n=1 Tax=Paraphaeosphaeria sporulosa TaxID=1460663 RepID=A0A177CZT5_9PLEO|nr:uncharacterized protein CC84DRAFT_1134574 [Paraphaeosphaeria sporulosa]OAG12179.1 hypothetical protein CC84DRAFT_1134574 [Paraphaeosphaeria sporulosa]
MTRRIVYSVGLWLTLASTTMTIASIYMPRWISFDPNNDGRKMSYGLHSRYTNIPNEPEYAQFPSREYCKTDESFCNMWRTVGFFISFDVAVELCTLVSFVVIISGGVQRRAAGWHIVSTLLLFCAFVQCVGMSIVAYLFDHHDRFSVPGHYLDASWSLCTVSWVTLFLTSLGMVASALYLPPEGDYELLPEDNLEIVQDEQLYSRIGAWNDGYHRNSGEWYQQYQETGSIRSQSVRSEAR